MLRLITTLGPKFAADLGIILPHEHIFVDLRTWDEPGYGQAAPADVVRVMAPYIAAAQAAGVTALVECSTGGVGRRADVDRAVSEVSGLPVIIPTGFYREPWIPPWVHAAEESVLCDFMLAELTGEVESSGGASWLGQVECWG